MRARRPHTNAGGGGYLLGRAVRPAARGRQAAPSPLSPCAQKWRIRSQLRVFNA
ncbi:MAG TPA: hypothetical protein VNT54_02375 [Solirubrobacteraceae bacterium]|nr:hypothetical protein [Solirubrobacteraceae bacterium]